MITAALAKASAEIRNYLIDFPNTYSPHRAQIDALLLRMEKLQQNLERPAAGPMEA